MRAYLITFFVAVVLLTGFRAARAQVTRSPPCFDVAVVATAPRYRWIPVQAGPDEIIIRSPVELTFEVEEVIGGSLRAETVTVDASLHTGFNRRIDHFLLYLRRNGASRLSLAGINTGIVEGDDGEFVWPITGPLDPSDLDPHSFIPANYQALLRPIGYNPANAWWLVSPYAERGNAGRIQAEAYPWGKVGKDRVVAPRGMGVRDLVRAAASRRCGPAG